jgi:hypothetical protein
LFSPCANAATAFGRLLLAFVDVGRSAEDVPKPFRECRALSSLSIGSDGIARTRSASRRVQALLNHRQELKPRCLILTTKFADRALSTSLGVEQSFGVLFAQLAIRVDRSTAASQSSARKREAQIAISIAFLFVSQAPIVLTQCSKEIAPLLFALGCVEYLIDTRCTRSNTSLPLLFSSFSFALRASGRVA